MYSRVTIMGHLGKEPELRSSKDGKPFAKFSLATTSGYGDKKKTSWYNVTVFGRQAELCQQFLHKGSIALVDGELDISEYESKDGKNHVSVNVLAQSVTFMPKSMQPNEQPNPQSKVSPSDAFYPDAVGFDDTFSAPF